MKPPVELFKNQNVFAGLSDRDSHPDAKQRVIYRITLCPTRGVLVYCVGHDYPYKSMPFPELVDTIAICKRLLLMATKNPFLIFGLNKLIGYAMNLFWIKEEYYLPCVKELKKVLPKNHIGELVAMTFMFDNAYRLRLQDWAGILDQETLTKKPLRHILDGLRKVMHREVGFVQQKKYRSVIIWVALMLLWPPMRKKVRSIDLQKMRYDEADLYWTGRRTDYNVNGEMI